jgi:hypothetical protein
MAAMIIKSLTTLVPLRWDFQGWLSTLLTSELRVGFDHEAGAP